MHCQSYLYRFKACASHYLEAFVSGNGEFNPDISHTAAGIIPGIYIENPI